MPRRYEMEKKGMTNFNDILTTEGITLIYIARRNHFCGKHARRPAGIGKGKGEEREHLCGFNEQGTYFLYIL